jgi:uncharacterized protein (DUF2237 family)
VGDDAAPDPGCLRAVALRLDPARDLTAGDGGQAGEGAHRDARPQAGVDEVHAGGLDGDPDLSGAGLRGADLLVAEVLGGPEGVEADGVHGGHPEGSTLLEVKGRPARRPRRVAILQAVSERNVLGGPLEPCGTDPLTGFYRDGCCSTGPEDLGSHTICAVVTSEFLAHQQSIGNDLTTPMPQYHFPGLVPGDRWCVTAVNWLRAYQDGSAAYVVLASTHERALELVPLDALRELAVDVPSDPGALG